MEKSMRIFIYDMMSAIGGIFGIKGDGLLYGRRAETYKSVVWIPRDLDDKSGGSHGGNDGVLSFLEDFMPWPRP